MQTKRKTRKQAGTQFIQLDTTKCKACWKCIDICPRKVIGRINLPWHKHALIVKSNNCIGCWKCIRVCEFNAITKVLSNNQA